MLKVCAAILILATIFGCSSPTENITKTSTPTPSSSATPVPSPTATPIPQVLLITEDPVPWEEDLAAWVLSSGWNLFKPDLASAADYLGESAAPIAAASVGKALDGELERAAARGLPILAVAVSGIESGESLSTVGNIRYDQAGFLAGVMTGLASQTGWVGQVTATGGPDEAMYGAGFTQGLLWGCPKCQLISQSAAEMTLDRFRANTVDVVFPLPGPEAEVAAEVLAAGDIPMVWVGSGGPAPDVLVGRIVFDEGAIIVEALEELIETGEGQAWVPSIETRSIIPVDINTNYLSPGRQRLFDAAYEAVAAGELDIGTDPDL